MREYGGDICFARLATQTLAKKLIQFQRLFITQLGHRHCLSTIAFILDIYL